MEGAHLPPIADAVTKIFDDYGLDVAERSVVINYMVLHLLTKFCHIRGESPEECADSFMATMTENIKTQLEFRKGLN